jgi:hypothetical protein
MSRNSAGTYSLPVTGNPVVPGTSVSSTWANTTFADIATEVSSSLDRQGRGPMLAPLQLQDGVVGAPALTWQSEPTSGLYKAAAGDVRMVVGGTLLQKWNASTTTLTGLVADVATINGNVTLAGSNPAGTTALANTLTKKNVMKAWATIKTDGGGGISCLDSFNVASVAINGGNTTARVTFAQAFANANYLFVGFPGFTVLPVCVGLSGSANKATTLCDIGLRAITVAGAGLVANLNNTIYEFYVGFYGQQ